MRAENERGFKNSSIVGVACTIRDLMSRSCALLRHDLVVEKKKGNVKRERRKARRKPMDRESRHVSTCKYIPFFYISIDGSTKRQLRDYTNGREFLESTLFIRGHKCTSFF